MSKELVFEKLEKLIVDKIEGLSGLELRHFYSENVPESQIGDLNLEDKRAFHFKESSAKVALVVRVNHSLNYMSASIVTVDSSKRFLHLNSYLKNNGKDSLLQQTEHWNGQRWVTDIDKYLELVSDLVTNEFKPVLQGEEWIDDVVDLDNYISGKK